MLNTTASVSSSPSGTSKNTFLNFLRPEKNFLSLYMSAESIHNVVPSGKMLSIPTPSDSLEEKSGNIPAFSHCSLDSWVLQSKVFIFSTSSPKKEIL